jgi:Capsule assembly protein Wzi
MVLISFSLIHSQQELVPVNNRIYQFLKQMELKGVIEDYNSANLPLSRNAAARFLNEIREKEEGLNPTEINILHDLSVEFGYDLTKNLDNSFSLLDTFRLKSILDDKKYKYLYAYGDKDASLFVDGTGSLSYRDFNAESYPKTSIGLGEIGLRLRGSLYNNLGYYLRLSNGQQIKGDYYSRTVAAEYDPKLISNVKFLPEKYFDSFEGYLRFESDTKALAVTFGREKLEFGTGYVDKLFLSGDAAPFDFGKIDLKYKALQYTFIYGNIKGDSLGTPLISKNIIAHRLDIRFSEKFRLGMYESIIASNRPLSFTYLNPLSFLTMADFSAEPKDQSNSLIGLDCEMKPWKNISVQFSFLIDDLNFKTIDNGSPSGDDNKFGYQSGLMLYEPLNLRNLTLSLEYTRLDPFVYSHRSNESSFTNWGVSLGHQLPPNSDEIAMLFNYDFSSRLSGWLKYQFQRSGEGVILDKNGNLIRNYGGDINRGDGDLAFTNTFLMGNRINRNIFTLHLHLEPIRQYFIDLEYSAHLINAIYSNTNYTDQYFYLTVSTDF